MTFHRILRLTDFWSHIFIVLLFIALEIVDSNFNVFKIDFLKTCAPYYGILFGFIELVSSFIRIGTVVLSKNNSKAKKLIYIYWILVVFYFTMYYLVFKPSNYYNIEDYFLYLIPAFITILYSYTTVILLNEMKKKT